MRHEDPYLMAICGTVVIVCVLFAVYVVAIIQRNEAEAEVLELRTQVEQLERENGWMEKHMGEIRAERDDSLAVQEPEPENQSLTDEIASTEAVLAIKESRTTETAGTLIGTFRVTHYCVCAKCCDVETGITSSGREAVADYTIAVDPSIIPLGSIVYLDYGDGVLHEYRADDTGGAVKGYTIDVCCEDHATALALGVREATVYLQEALK